MRRGQYECALVSDDLETVVRAYRAASRIAWDRRFRADRRAVAKEFLPQLTRKLRDVRRSMKGDDR